MPHRPGPSLWRHAAVLPWLLLTGAAAHADEWLYRVAPGDTLIAIGRKYLAEPRGWRDLQRLNQVAAPRRLQTGRTLRVPVAWLRDDATVATVALVEGAVERHRDHAAPAPAQAGMRLHAGDRVVVGADGAALLTFADGSRTLLTPGTRLTITELLVQRGTGAVSTRLDLGGGAVETEVRRDAPRPRFELRAPALNLGVRGTEFRLRFDADSGTAHAEVLAGRVAAAAPGAPAAPTPLDAGFGLVAGRDGVGAPQPLAPPPSLAGVSDLVERLPLRLAWPQAEPAPAWRVQVAPAAAPERLLVDRRVAEPRLRWADLPDGDYRLRVRALDAAGLEGRHADIAFRVKARPEPPLLRDPVHEVRVYDDPVPLRWTAPDGVQRYRLQVAAGHDFAAPVHDVEVAATEATLALPPGRWWWRVRSVRAADDAGPWGDAQTFERRERPAAPSSLAPRIDRDRVQIAWAARAGETVTVQLARDDGFTDLVAERVAAQSGTELPLPGPGTYWVRVRATDDAGVSGPWGPPNRLDVPAAPVWPWLVPAALLILLLL